jgi:hypothetical protein
MSEMFDVDISNVLVEQSALDQAEDFISRDENLDTLSEELRQGLVEAIAKFIIVQEIQVMMDPPGYEKGGYIQFIYPDMEYRYIMVTAKKIEGGTERGVYSLSQEQFDAVIDIVDENNKNT